MIDDYDISEKMLVQSRDWLQFGRNGRETREKRRMREDVYISGDLCPCAFVLACLQLHALRCRGKVGGRDREEETDEEVGSDSNQGHTQILC